MGPGQYPQYICAHYGRTAVGSSTPQEPKHTHTDAILIMQLLRDNLTTLTSDQEPVKTDEPATTEAVSALEPAAESPVETAEAEIAEESNTEGIMVESAALNLTKRRLELWNQSTSRKLMIQVLPNRVCSLDAERTDHRVRERRFTT